MQIDCEGGLAILIDDSEAGNSDIQKARELAHELNNALEVVVQSSFLVGTLNLGENGKQWYQLMDKGLRDSIKINAELRETLRRLDKL